MAAKAERYRRRANRPRTPGSTEYKPSPPAGSKNLDGPSVAATGPSNSVAFSLGAVAAAGAAAVLAGGAWVEWKHPGKIIPWRRFDVKQPTSAVERANSSENLTPPPSPNASKANPAEKLSPPITSDASRGKAAENIPPSEPPTSVEQVIAEESDDEEEEKSEDKEEEESDDEEEEDSPTDDNRTLDAENPKEKDFIADLTRASVTDSNYEMPQEETFKTIVINENNARLFYIELDKFNPSANTEILTRLSERRNLEMQVLESFVAELKISTEKLFGLHDRIVAAACGRSVEAARWLELVKAGRREQKSIYEEIEHFIASFPSERSYVKFLEYLVEMYNIYYLRISEILHKASFT